MQKDGGHNTAQGMLFKVGHALKAGHTCVIGWKLSSTVSHSKKHLAKSIVGVKREWNDPVRVSLVDHETGESGGWPFHEQCSGVKLLRACSYSGPLAQLG